METQPNNESLPDYENFNGFWGKAEMDPIARQVIDEIERRLRERFGGEKEAEFPFHNIEHSVRVSLLAKHILDTIQQAGERQGLNLVPESDKKAVIVAPAGHDMHIDTASGVASGMLFRFRGFSHEELLKVMRGPFTPFSQPASGSTQEYEADLKARAGDKEGNEGESVKETIAIVEQVDPNGEYYDAETKAKIAESIRATYPAVNPFAKVSPDIIENVKEGVSKEAGKEITNLDKYLNPDGTALRFFQPALLDNEGKYTSASLSALALALSDLVYVSAIRPSDDPMRKSDQLVGLLPTFTEMGNAEYRETRQRIGYKLSHPDMGVDSLQHAERVNLVKDMLKWMQSQVQFALCQKSNLEEIFAQNVNFNIPGKEKEKEKEMEIVKQTLRDECFPNFYKNIFDAMKRYDGFVGDKNTIKEVNEWVDKMNEEELKELARKLVSDFGYETRPELAQTA